MQVKKLIWNGKKDSDAEAIITDGEFECLAFCFPCKISEGDILRSPLESLMAENVMITKQNESCLKKDSESHFGYSGVGQLTDKNKGLIKIGELILCLDAFLPSDLQEGQFVEFKCGRIDVRG